MAELAHSPTDHRRVGIWLTLIVLVSLAPKVARLNAPFLDAYWMRDLVDVSIAHNWVERGLHLFWPETDYTPDQPNYLEMELPLTPALTALAWRVTGEHEWVPRLLSALWSTGAVLLFFGIARRFLSLEGALAATWVFALSPINLFMGRKFMPEPMTLCLSMACVWGFVRWAGTAAPDRNVGRTDGVGGEGIRSGADWWLALAGVAGGLAALTKPPIIHVLLPLGWLAVRERGWRGLGDWRLWAFGLGVVGPMALWMGHAARIGEQYWSVGTTFAAGSWFSGAILSDPAFLSMMVQRFTQEVLTPLGVVGALLGLALVGRQSREFFFSVWLIAALVYFLALLGGNARQTYYQLWFVAPAAGLAGCAWERLVAPTGCGRRLAPWLLVGLLVWAVWGVHNYLDEDQAVLHARAALDRVAPERSPIIVYPAGYNCLYYLGRPGWCGRDTGRDYRMEATGNPRYITDRIARGARYCVIFTAPDPVDFRDRRIESYLARAHAPVAHDEGFLIYRLTPD